MVIVNDRSRQVPTDQREIALSTLPSPPVEESLTSLPSLLRRQNSGTHQLYAEYCARADGHPKLSASVFALQIAVETRVGLVIDECFWMRLLAAPDHLLANTRQLLTVAAK